MEEFSRELTDDEYYLMYGDRKIKINECFVDGVHYYIQRENDVLHCRDGIINSLHVGFLNNEKLKKISKKAFDLKMKEILYHLDISDYIKDSK